MKRAISCIGIACATAFSALLCMAAGASAAEATATTAAKAAMPTAAMAKTAAAPATTSELLNNCATSIGDKPRIAMQGCLNAELKKARDGMRAAYAQVEADLKRIDSAATPEALRTLKHSQDSFTSFMHKECKRQGAALLGGSGAGDTDLACQVALTQWRTAQLRQP